MSANDCIKYAVIKNWVGFEADWIKNVKPEKTASHHYQKH